MVNVIPSGPPEGAILEPTNIGRYYSDVPVLFSAQVQDAEADPEDLELTWNSSVDGELDLALNASNDGTYLDSTQLSEGNHRIELTITDPQGNTGQDSVEITVGGPNQSPLCEITLPADGESVESGYSTTFRGTASDPDVPSNELSATWQSNIDGVLSTNVPTAAGEVVADAVLSGGAHTITLAVTDETGATCTDFVLYTVSVPPTITVNSPQINEVFNNENPVFLDATVNDQEDPSSALVVEWISDADGLLHTQNADSNGTATVNIEGLSLGYHTLTARVTDLSGLTAERVIPIEVADCGQVFWYPDLDQDGYGDPNPLTLFTGCSPPSLHVSQPGDCDDTNPLVYSGATEYCNGYDDNCDGVVDENTAADVQGWYLDSDGDQYGQTATLVVSCYAPAHHVNTPGDCDDAAFSTHPGAIDICDDGIDQDCSGIDESCQIELGLANAHAKLIGLSDYDHAGWSILGEVNVNGDAYADLLIGAPGNGSNSDDAGVVYVLEGPLTGGINLHTTAVSRIFGDNIRDYAGIALAPAGDTNNDGLDDFWLGAYQQDDGASDAGSVYLFESPFSGDQTLVDASVQLIGNDIQDYSGYSIDGNQDFNGDGVMDLIVGAYQESSFGTYAGASYLVYGPFSGTDSFSNASVTLYGENAGDFNGWDVAFIGDTNGDGLSEIATSAYGYDNNSNSTGAVYVVNGSPNLSGTVSLFYADATFFGEGLNHFAGRSVDSAGDFNGDGYQDMVIGASGEDSTAAGAGAAYVIYGPMTGTQSLSTAPVKYLGEDGSNYAGRGVSAAGDLDGDGNDDLLIGAPGESSAATNAGAAYVIHGPETGVFELYYTYAKLTGEALDDGAGFTISPAGDIDADGQVDILVGAPTESYAGFEAGAVYLIAGGQF